MAAGFAVRGDSLFAGLISLNPDGSFSITYTPDNYTGRVREQGQEPPRIQARNLEWAQAYVEARLAEAQFTYFKADVLLGVENPEPGKLMPIDLFENPPYPLAPIPIAPDDEYAGGSALPNFGFGLGMFGLHDNAPSTSPNAGWTDTTGLVSGGGFGSSVTAGNAPTTDNGQITAGDGGSASAGAGADAGDGSGGDSGGQAP